MINTGSRIQLSLRVFVAANCVFSLLLITAGCGGGGDVKLVSVEGTVTVAESEPFAGGIVRFTPRGKAKTSGATALTEDDGTYVLKHQSQRKGIEPGEYVVSFSLYKMPDGSPVPDQEGENEPKSPEELGAVECVPREYSSILSDKNPVTVTKAGGSFDFKIPALNKPKKR